MRRAKLRESLRTRANLKGLLIGQAAPSQVPTGAANQNSKRWVLRRPEGQTYECYGLRSWAKANVELFGWFDPTHKTPAHLIILQRLCVVASGRAEHFRGWTVLVRDGVPIDLHLAAIGEIHAAAKARKAVRERERRQRFALARFSERLGEKEQAA